LIQKLNDNPDVHGILCQLPLPKHICEDHVIQAIDPQKDVDGFHPQNVGALVVGKKGFVSGFIASGKSLCQAACPLYPEIEVA
jgi:methylenetetrahydrofolate dehydrogenase (NADP+)/methenyltetrahydrofolate cyclohydrolase